MFLASPSNVHCPVKNTTSTRKLQTSAKADVTKLLQFPLSRIGKNFVKKLDPDRDPDSGSAEKSNRLFLPEYLHSGFYWS